MAAFMAAMLSLGIAAGTVGAKADGLVPVDASSGLNLYTLSQGGYLKLTGRAIPNSAGYLETDFSSSGFEVIINAPAATTFQLTVSSNASGSDAKGRYTIYVDEEFHSFITDRASNVTVSQAISAGQHTIRVVKEAIVGYGVTDYSRMNSIQK